MSQSRNRRYQEAGVDIDAGNALVERIKPAAKSTARPGIMGGLGGFGALFDLKAAGFDDPILVAATDGVGTKLKLAMDMRRHTTIGIDLVAMCVNDLIVQGATPLFFLDYYATGKLQIDAAADVIEGIAEGCRQAGCALVGGETAEMPGMYHGDDYDLAGFAVGAVSRTGILPRGDLAAGDVLLGLASSGVHSNGYSLVRKILAEQAAELSSATPFASTHATLGDALLTPTRIYVKSLLPQLPRIKALAHITGGGLTENLPRVLPEALGARIDLGSWKLPGVFDWLQRSGEIDEADLLRTFNCGIGMILVVRAGDAESISAALTQSGETVYRIGTISEKTSERVSYSSQLTS